MGALASWVGNPDDGISARTAAELIAAADPAILPSRLCRSATKVATRIDAMRALARVWSTACADSVPYYRALAKLASESPVLRTVHARMDELTSAYQSAPAAFGEAMLRIAPPWRTPQDMSAELLELSIDLAKGGGSVSGGVVRVMTYRQAKGLEADAVVILGLEDDLFRGAAGTTNPSTLRNRRGCSTCQ